MNDGRITSIFFFQGIYYTVIIYFCDQIGSIYWPPVVFMMPSYSVSSHYLPFGDEKIILGTSFAADFLLFSCSWRLAGFNMAAMFLGKTHRNPFVILQHICQLMENQIPTKFTYHIHSKCPFHHPKSF